MEKERSHLRINIKKAEQRIIQYVLQVRATAHSWGLKGTVGSWKWLKLNAPEERR